MPMNVSKSPEPVPVQQPTNTATPSRRPAVGWILAAIVLGIVTGAVGTVTHLNSYWTGTFGLPWGVLLALVIAGMAQWWIGLMSVNIWATGLTGIAQYLTLAAMIGFSRGDNFTVPLTAETWEFVPHLVIATLVWHLGLIVLTILMVLRVNRLVRRTRQEPAEQQSADALLSTDTAWDNR